MLTFQLVLDRFDVLTGIVGVTNGVEIRIIIGTVGIFDLAGSSFPSLCLCRWRAGLIGR
jgi:hypothetical protein